MKIAGKKDCNCGTSLSPLYATVTTRNDSLDSARARVHMRGSLLVNTSDGLRRLMPAEEVELPFSLIKECLDSSASILYFDRSSDRALFLAAYPEFQGQI